MQYNKTKKLKKRSQVVCGLQELFPLLNCQTPEQFSEAIPALQRARSNPNLRVKAMLMLGRCYAAKNMTDMAIRQLEEANSEQVNMDDTKKEILYSIGNLYEIAGNKDKALENYKVIYEVDYGYRDVAQKVESAYS